MQKSVFKMGTINKLYIQKMTFTDSQGTQHVGTLKETIANFGLYPMRISTGMGGEAKDLPSNDWPEWDGIEEYAPEEGIPLKSYDMEIGFGYRYDGTITTGVTGHSKTALKTFINYLRGADGSGVWMRLYCEQTLTGMNKVRFVSCDVPDDDFYRLRKGERVFLTVKLRVTDPVTEIIKSNNQLTPPNG